MTDHLVSVRLPSSLVHALRKIAEDEHYLDLSECIRSIIRKEASQQKKPKENRKQQLQEQLKKILTELEETK